MLNKIFLWKFFEIKSWDSRRSFKVYVLSLDSKSVLMRTLLIKSKIWFYFILFCFCSSSAVSSSLESADAKPPNLSREIHYIATKKKDYSSQRKWWTKKSKDDWLVNIVTTRHFTSIFFLCLKHHHVFFHRNLIYVDPYLVKFYSIFVKVYFPVSNPSPVILQVGST